MYNKKLYTGKPINSIKRVDKTLKENVVIYAILHPFIVLYNFAMIIGGLIFFAYFTLINYFPTSLDIGSSAFLIISAAMVGLLFIAIFIAIPIFPGIIIKTYLGGRKSPFDKALKQTSINPFSFVVFIAPLLFFGIIISIALFTTDGKTAASIAMVSVFVLTILFTFIQSIERYQVNNKFEAYDIIYAFTIFLVLTFFLIAIISLGIFLKVPTDMIGGLTLILIVIYVLTYQEKDILKIIFAMFFIVITVLIISGRFSSIPKGVFQLLHLSSMKKINLVVNKTGCELFLVSKFIEDGSCDGNSSVYLIKDVSILLNIGSEYVIKVSEENAKDRIILSNKYVVGKIE